MCRRIWRRAGAVATGGVWITDAKWASSCKMRREALIASIVGLNLLFAVPLVAGADPPLVESPLLPAPDSPPVNGEAADQRAPEPVEPARAEAEKSETPLPESAEIETSAARITTADEDPPVEPASFKGLRPGVSSALDLQAALGAPTEVREEGGVAEHAYEVEPFDRVTVSVDDGKVATIVISMRQRFTSDALAKELGLEGIRAVDITDAKGKPLGLAYPERGVLFSFVPSQSEQQVAQVILDRVDPQSFVLRAETNQRKVTTASLKDLEVAETLDAGFARIYWVRARIMISIGDAESAVRAARRAVQLEPGSAEYRLTRAEALAAVGDYLGAAAETKDVLSQRDLANELKAQALLQLGDQIAAGPARDYRQAVDHHLQAIRTAKPLVDDEREAIRQSARQTLFEAHLAVANDIAWGPWLRKSEVVPMWLKRATTLVDESSDEDALQLCRQSLAACVGVSEQMDPAPFAEKAVELGEKLIASAEDPLARRRQQRELGMALYDALQAHHARREFEPALKLGLAAVEHLEQTHDPAAHNSPGQAYLMGRLYFRIGSIYAIHHQDHGQAIPWFEKAVPLIEQPLAVSALGDAGRQGESLVSMGVSFWETHHQEEALRITTEGLRLMEQAVNRGILADTALAVPYGNLSSMHQTLGNLQKAHDYRQMASRLDRPERR